MGGPRNCSTARPRVRFGRPDRTILLLLVVCVVAAGGLRPSPAAAAVRVTVDTPAAIGPYLKDCVRYVSVRTRAEFSEPAAYAEVELSVSGVPGRFDSRSGGSFTSAQFTFHFAGLAPGTYAVTAHWLAHNGNGLSRGTGTNTTSFTVPEKPPLKRFDEVQQCHLDEMVRWFFLGGVLIGAGGIVLGVLCPVCTLVVLGLEAVMVAFEVAALATWKLEHDPPDKRFRQTVVPRAPPLKPVSRGAGFPAPVADAMDPLIATLGRQLVLTEAILACMNKAWGARKAHDKVWEQRQMRAAGRFAAQVARLADRQERLRVRLRTSWVAAGLPNPTLSAVDVSSYQDRLWEHGFAPRVRQRLRGAGLTTADLRQVRARMLDGTYDRSTPVSMADVLAGPATAAAAPSLAAEMRAFARRARNKPLDTASGAIPAGTALLAGCVGASPCGRLRALQWPKFLALSPDDRWLYVSAQDSNALVLLRRDPKTGTLRQPPGRAGCVSVGGSGHAPGCSRSPGLTGAAGVAVSPNGRDVYVAASGGTRSSPCAGTPRACCVQTAASVTPQHDPGGALQPLRWPGPPCPSSRRTVGTST